MKYAAKHITLLLVLPVLFSGCATIVNPATGKKQFVMIGTQEEVSIGNQVATEVETNFKLSKDEALIERANRIGLLIAKVSDRQDVRYYFRVLEDEDPNALSTPGGYVYVNSGLMRRADDNELAAVIAHEVGHIAARHSVMAMQSNMATSLIAALVFSSVKTKQEMRQGAAVALNLVMLGYSREDEFEADKLGVKYAYSAGFDPYGMVNFLEKLQRENKENPLDKGLVYLKSHPLYSERIAKARAYAARLESEALKN
ncbi:MAG: M48 family metallopeptidase [Candidatus Omnitrophica bacterium]|nr:M48 family metallopeptidase [Candidatus Omnitrophota bacterium]